MSRETVSRGGGSTRRSFLAYPDKLNATIGTKARASTCLDIVSAGLEDKYDTRARTALETAAVHIRTHSRTRTRTRTHGRWTYIAREERRATSTLRANGRAMLMSRVALARIGTPDATRQERRRGEYGGGTSVARASDGQHGRHCAYMHGPRTRPVSSSEGISRRWSRMRMRVTRSWAAGCATTGSRSYLRAMYVLQRRGEPRCSSHQVRNQHVGPMRRR